MKRRRVAVVGAGLAGVTAARTLTDMGHEVVVFEKSDRIGGKCCTRWFEGQPYELGACSVSPEFDTILRFARRYAARLKRRFPFWILQPDGSRTSFRSEYWRLADTPRVLAGAARYLFHAANFALRYDRPSTFGDIPPLYQLPFAEFCERGGMSAIAPWMELPVTSFGYGDLRTIKTWYVLDYVDAVNFLGLALLVLTGKSPVHQLARGYEDLVQRVAKGLDVRLGCPVRHLERGPDGVRIGIEGEAAPLAFDDVVLAVSLQELDQDMLTPRERELAERIHWNEYALVAWELQGMPHDNHLLRFLCGKEHYGHVALIERGLHGNASDLSVCYIPVMENRLEDVDLLALLRQDLARMGIVPKTERPLAFERWIYFSHFVDPAAYRVLEALQGTDHTYYVGGMAKFELAERVAREAEALVACKFEGRRPREWFARLRNWLYFYGCSLGPYSPAPPAEPTPPVT